MSVPAFGTCCEAVRDSASSETMPEGRRMQRSPGAPSTNELSALR
jgi:hypothetical protein